MDSRHSRSVESGHSGSSGSAEKAHHTWLYPTDTPPTGDEGKWEWRKVPKGKWTPGPDAPKSLWKDPYTGEPYSQHPDTGDWYRYGPDRELSEINHQMIEKYKLSEGHLAILYQAEFKLHQQVDAMKVSGKFPNNFPTEEVWRFLLDHKDQATRGKYGYENERGYMAGMMRGFTMMLQHLGERLTPQIYELLHVTCVDGVHDTKGNKMQKFYKSSFISGFLLTETNCSNEGYRELLAKYNCRDSGDPRYPDGHPVGKALLPLSNDGGPTTKETIEKYKKLGEKMLDVTKDINK
jgi:hypothetical protein